MRINWGDFKWFEFCLLLMAAGLFLFSGLVLGSKGEILSQLHHKLIIGSKSTDFDAVWCNSTKTLHQAVGCLRNNLQGYYNYNVRTGINSTYNLTDILQNGGDCTEYSYFWKIMLERLNYTADYKYLYPKDKNTTKGHVFIIAYSDDLNEYCTIDQLNYDCMDLDLNYTK